MFLSYTKLIYKLVITTAYFSFITIIFLTCSNNSPVKPGFTNGSLYGTVKDKYTLFPIEGAVVTAISNSIADTTNQQGLFVLENVSAGKNQLSISANGYQVSFQTIDIIADSQYTDLFITGNENLNLYIGTYGGNDLFAVDVDRLEKTDSIYFHPGNMQDLTITPGGSKIYVTFEDNDIRNVYYLDVTSKTYHLTDLPYGVLSFNPNNELLLATLDGLFKVDTLTDMATLIDSNPIFPSQYHPTQTIFYGKKPYNPFLYVYDYVQNTILDSIAVDFIHSVITPDGSEFYFISPNGYLGVIDLNTKQIVEIINANRQAHIAVTPDGQYVLLTDPDSNIPPIQGSGLIAVVNTNTLTLDGYIDVRPLPTYKQGTDNIMITPSGKYAFITSGLSEVFVVDVSRREAIKVIDFFPYGATLRALLLGSKK